MRPFLIASLGALGLSAAAVTISLPGTGKDYAALPPAPAEVEKQIKEQKITLVQAIEAAQKETTGLARSAQLDLGSGTIEVLCYGGGQARRVSIDTTTGAVKATVTEPRFPGDPVTGEWTETPSGLKYYDIRPGTGEQPTPTAKVKVHYTGWLVDGTKFDSSLDRGTPTEFPLNRVIPAWTEGVGSMKVGGKRKLIVPPALGYGAKGAGGVIPPNASLVFDVELLEIMK